jgi:hypothetical protein
VSKKLAVIGQEEGGEHPNALEGIGVMGVMP